MGAILNGSLKIEVIEPTVEESRSLKPSQRVDVNFSGENANGVP
jgi:hypothetical protein